MKQNPETPAETHETNRVSESELKELLTLRQQSMNAEQSNAPTVADIAEAYDIPDGEVEHLLQQVRAGRQPLAKALRQRKKNKIKAVSFAIVGSIFLFNFNFIPNSHSNPVFTVQSVTQTQTNSGSIEHVDVVLQHHPSSLKHFVMGPQWNHPWDLVTVTDAQSGDHTMFPKPGGEKSSVGFGWCYRMGMTGFHVGYDIPLSKGITQPISIRQNFPIDGTDTELTIPLTPINGN